MPCPCRVKTVTSFHQSSLGCGDESDGADLVRSRLLVVAQGRVVEEWFTSVTFGTSTDGDDKVAHCYPRCMSYREHSRQRTRT